MLYLGQETGYAKDLDLSQETGYSEVLDLGQKSDYPDVFHGFMRSLDANSDSTLHESKFALLHIIYNLLFSNKSMLNDKVQN